MKIFNQMLALFQLWRCMECVSSQHTLLYFRYIDVYRDTLLPYFLITEYKHIQRWATNDAKFLEYRIQIGRHRCYAF